MSTPKERLDLVAQAISQNPEFDGIDPEEVLRILEYTESDLSKINDIAGIIIYIHKRYIEKASRVDSFRAAFPARCVYAENSRNAPYQRVDMERDEISVQAIDIKAKRLEARPLFKKIYALLSTSLYISYAVERMVVLDEAFKRSMNDKVADRDRVQYMKLFLEETRKPEEAGKGLEVNVNVQHNQVNMVSVEEHLGAIAKALKGKSATEVIEVLSQKKETA